MAKTEDGLTDKQRAFVREYLADNNGTQAAIRAGYSPNGAEVQAHRLLSNAKIRALVDASLKKADSAALNSRQITKERLLEMAEAIYNGAMSAEQFSAATGAVKELGVLSGERVEKSEATIVSHEDRLTAIKERVNERRTTH